MSSACRCGGQRNVLASHLVASANIFMRRFSQAEAWCCRLVGAEQTICRQCTESAISEDIGLASERGRSKMTTRRHCERSADNSNRRMRGASAARLWRRVRHDHCPTNRAFSRLAKVRTCDRSSSLSGDDHLRRHQGDSLNRSHAKMDFQVSLGMARGCSANLLKRRRKARAETRIGAG